MRRSSNSEHLPESHGTHGVARENATPSKIKNTADTTTPVTQLVDREDHETPISLEVLEAVQWWQDRDNLTTGVMIHPKH